MVCGFQEFPKGAAKVSWFSGLGFKVSGSRGGGLLCEGSVKGSMVVRGFSRELHRFWGSGAWGFRGVGVQGSGSFPEYWRAVNGWYTEAF